VIINGTTVTVHVPQGSDDDSTQFSFQVVVENGAGPLPSPVMINTDRVNSCAPTQSGAVVCSGQQGTVDLVPAGGAPPPPTILPLSGGTPPRIEYAAGDCIGCGAMVDDSLNLGIISSGLGFIPVNLPNKSVGAPIAVNGTYSDEVPGAVFGYDKINHRILSANYQVTDAQFNQTPPRFQIVDISNPANPLIYEFAKAPAFFNKNGRTCATNIVSDTLPDTTAIDTSTNIAYVTFHTKSACFRSPPNDIAMFDMSRATFNNTNHTWDTPSTLIQSITGTGLNGIDPISVDSNSHLALVSAGDNNFGVLVLPTTSGVGANLAITDYINALMPNDPDGNPWVGWDIPNGLATYVSPNSGKVIGVMMNHPMSGGMFFGSTYLALVDMQGLLNPALRDKSPGNGHKIDRGVNLLTSGLVSFVKVK